MKSEIKALLDILAASVDEQNEENRAGLLSHQMLLVLVTRSSSETIEPIWASGVIPIQWAILMAGITPHIATIV